MTNRYFGYLFFICSFITGCATQQEYNDEKIIGEKMPAPKDPFHKLCQYWEVTDAENPTYRDIYDNQVQGVYNYPGIVFMTDSTFLEDPRATMRYGKFTLKGKVINAEFDDGKKAIYTIEDVQADTMKIRREEKGQTTILYVAGDRVFWPDASTNPYNKINSKWRIKPPKAESPQELNERLKEFVRFYQYLFIGYAESDNNKVDFMGLPSCFNWYQGGITVQNKKRLDKKWINCFYSEEQALQARQMIEDNLTSKKYNWDTTQTNWLKQTADVLKQIHDKM